MVRLTLSGCGCNAQRVGGARTRGKATGDTAAAAGTRSRFRHTREKKQRRIPRQGRGMAKKEKQGNAERAGGATEATEEGSW
jgi:hypothetical protein